MFRIQNAGYLGSILTITKGRDGFDMKFSKTEFRGHMRLPKVKSPKSGSFGVKFRL